MENNLNPEEKNIFEYLSNLNNPIQNSQYCSECNWRGYIIDNNGKANSCDCVLQKQLHRIYKNAGIPALYWDKTILQDWSVQQDGKGNDLGSRTKQSKLIKTFFLNYANHLSSLAQGNEIKLIYAKGLSKNISSLIIKGGSYSGKTFLSSVLAQECLNKGITTKYYNWNLLINYLQDYSYKEEQNTIFEEFQKCEFIFIDGIYDYGINYKNFIFQLDRLFTQRALLSLPTVVTTEIDLLGLDYGPAFMSFTQSAFTIPLPEKKI